MEQIELNEKIKELQKIIDSSNNIVFFGGAGVSTESGIPDFRSTDGLYNQQWKYPPEQIISHTFFLENPKEFYRFYRAKLLAFGIEPNPAHYKLAELENAGKLKAIVTQNIDGLHQKAGSKKVYELHGSVLRNHCMDCGEFYDTDFIMDEANCRGNIPICPKCGGIIKPDVVLYEEALDEACMMGAINAIEKADTMIIGGTSLVVYPAAGLIRYFRGKKLVLINKQPTPYDGKADLVINDAIGKVMEVE